MRELPEESKALLREFKDSPFFHAYREFVLLEAGKCLGQIRTSKGDDAYVKGQMFGIEKLMLDLMSDMVERGEEKKANRENREYTEYLLETAREHMQP